MFVRKKKNRSGSTSIVIIDKSNGFKELVTIGTSCDPNQIEALYNKGLEWIRRYGGQFSLDLYGERKQAEKFLDRIDQLLINGTELLLGKLFNDIGFSAIEDDTFRHLVLSRLSFPSSKRATVSYLKDYYDVDLDLSKIYRYLDCLHNKHKKRIEEISVAHTTDLLGGVIGIVFYDVTTLYFETDKGDNLRKRGFSKEGKHQNPQIVLGLLVSIGGYPLAYEIFEGNKFEGHTMLPIIDEFTSRYRVKDSIVVADSGLMSAQNILDLEAGGYKYIIGARLRNESEKIKNWVLSLGLRNGEFAEYPKYKGCRLIIGYSTQRARKDYENRKKGLERLENQFRNGRLTKSNINKRGYNKYLTMEGDVSIKIDYDMFSQDAKWDGVKGYLTNTKLSCQEVYANYSHLWKIENAFRITKSQLEVRPIFHFNRQRIEAHICICFAAYKIYKELELQLKKMKSGLSTDNAIDIARTICTIRISLPQTKERIERVILLTEKQKELGRLFNLG